MQSVSRALLAFVTAAGVIHGARAQATVRPADPTQVAESRVEAEAKLITAFGLSTQGDTEAALALYRELLAADPANAAAAYSAARLLEGDEATLEEAVKLMQQAHRADPDNAYVAQALAELLTRADRHALAADTYGELFARFPGRLDFLLRQSQSLAEAARPNLGLKAIQAYLARGGRLTPELGQQRFTLAVSMNDGDVATRALEELIEAFPDDPAYYQELGQFYRRTGNELAARQVWERMAARFPDDERAALALAGQSKLNAEEQAFIDRLMPLFESAGIGIDAKIAQLLPIAQEVAERGDTVLANRVLPLARTLTEVHPDEAKAHAIYADLLAGARRHRAAADAYAATVERDGSVFLVWENYLATLRALAAPQELLDVSDEALVRFPNQARLYYYNGLGLAGTGDLRAAENTLREGGIIALNDQVLRYDLLDATAELQLRQARFSEALATADEALTVRPTYGPALARRAEVLLRSGDAAAAQEFVAKATDADARHPYVLTVEALAQVHAGNTQRARELLDTAAARGATSMPLYQETAGDVAYFEGDAASARDHWERARTHGGGSHRIDEKLAEGKFVK